MTASLTGTSSDLHRGPYTRVSLVLFTTAMLTTAMLIACDGPSGIEDAGVVEPEPIPLPIIDGGGPGVQPPDGGEPDVAVDGGEPDVGVDGGEPDVVVDGGEPDVPTDGGSPDVAVDAGEPEVDAGPQIIYSVALEGEACFVGGGTPCDVGLVCASIFNSGGGTCARSCADEGQACATGGTCADLVFQDNPNLICADVAATGGGCSLEQLQLCGPDGACLPDDTDPLGGTCRDNCICPGGATTCASTCAAGACVVIDMTDGSGFCGTGAAVGSACSPTAGGVFCEGDALCIIDVETPGSGTCRARCDIPGDADATCLALATPHACFGAVDAGQCLPTTQLGQGNVCTLAAPVPDIALSCAAGLGCIRVHDSEPAGQGRCLTSCAANGSADCPTGAECFNVETVAPGGGLRCLREFSRGDQGCNPPEPTCDASVCVTDANGGGICRETCTVASCPGAGCECAGAESCLGKLADPLVGICGTTVTRGEFCDEDAEVFCEDAPNEDIATNAFSICLGSCFTVCSFDPADGPPVTLDCPAGLVCAPDPTGRLLPTVLVCVDPPQDP